MHSKHVTNVGSLRRGFDGYLSRNENFKSNKIEILLPQIKNIQ